LRAPRWNLHQILNFQKNKEAFDDLVLGVNFGEWLEEMMQLWSKPSFAA